ncbi:hypothetical protein AUJ10_03500 [Candidatus Pacearchaeota archaeon CG1_02_31_27]|nr:MAG: hypothetical protein AUJ10_03500 [Candidatus Pacearchaeota archaeon CG1_02_31_27]PIN92123.1 MAG: hypothetical protein COU55_02525 [Candidatus Pacearchaeota archaeon CG10_big_fil_rev_8_21_14_0_10_31_59]PIZ80501.1 MAG: hypothetical protein COX99_02395 [Candidatus Pacearchaeota archaeon CG_4_10_14_0_2_um_filter_31_10]
MECKIKESKKISAGLLMYRIISKKLEVFLAHPGGLYYTKRNRGLWGIPKGEIDGQGIFQTAIREFNEETGIKVSEKKEDYIYLGTVKQKSGKIVYAWAFEKDFNGKIKSNTCSVEWPPKSGKKLEIPEVDKAEFFDEEEAREIIIPEQFEFIERLKEKLKI